MMLIYPKNISREELIFSATANKYNINNDVPTDEVEQCLLRVAWTLQNLRDKLEIVTGKVHIVIVSSGYRCDALNSHPKIKGSKNSAHRFANAVDFTVVGMSVAETVEFIVTYMPELVFDQLINEYDSWVHLGLVRYTGEQRQQVLHKS